MKKVKSAFVWFIERTNNNAGSVWGF